MNVTYYGHSCIGVELGGRHLLFDPFIKSNPLAAAIKLESIGADYILVSHGHRDHVGDCVELAKLTGATVVASFEVATWLGKNGAPKVHPINHGSTRFDFGRLRYVNAIHSSGLPDGSYGGNPGGFVVESPQGNFYFSGDTALTSDMKLIGETTSLAFAALCLGGNFTMDVADALIAARFVNCANIIGLHYDTFPPIKINHEEAISQFAAAGRKLHLMAIGSTAQF